MPLFGKKKDNNNNNKNDSPLKSNSKISATASISSVFSVPSNTAPPEKHELPASVFAKKPSDHELPVSVFVQNPTKIDVKPIMKKSGSVSDIESLISDVSCAPTMATVPESLKSPKTQKVLPSISENKKSCLKNTETNSNTNKLKNKRQISPRNSKNNNNSPKSKNSKVTISAIPPAKHRTSSPTKPKNQHSNQDTRKSMHNTAFSTQVNRLLKQNTQQLFENLSPEVRKAFQTLFDRIDVTDSGAITAKEIQHLIRKHTNKNLTLNQVQKVLTDLDVKGTGDIEFDEFIFMLSQPSNYVRLLDKRDLKGLKGNTGKETQKILDQKNDDGNETTYVFFEALRNATKQDSMTALRTFYKNRLKKLNDHVIHDWSAGQRCIGLSDQEMLKRYETIQGELLRQRVNFCKDNSYKTSPYARPLEWGVMNLREAIVSRRLKAQELKTKKVEPRRVKMSEFVVTPKAVPLPRYSIEKRSPLKKTFNYDQLADIREKVDDIAKDYYGQLKKVAGENSKVIQKEIAVDEIKNKSSQANFMHTFEAYCAPFVVSPWIPMPSPTLQASFSPLGRSKLGAMRQTETVLHGSFFRKR